VEPCAFVDQAAKTAGPLMEEFVDVVAAHLVYDQEDHEFGTGRGLSLRGAATDLRVGVCP